jgi:hypothetical protein
MEARGSQVRSQRGPHRKIPSQKQTNKQKSEGYLFRHKGVMSHECLKLGWTLGFSEAPPSDYNV